MLPGNTWRNRRLSNLLTKRVSGHLQQVLKESIDPVEKIQVSQPRLANMTQVVL